MKKRDAALRAKATTGIGGAVYRLEDAMKAALYNRPKSALLAIRRAEAKLEKAKAALVEWGMGGV